MLYEHWKREVNFYEKIENNFSRHLYTQYCYILAMNLASLAKVLCTTIIIISIPVGSNSFWKNKIPHAWSCWKIIWNYNFSWSNKEFCKKLFWKLVPNSQKNISAGVSLNPSSMSTGFNPFSPIFLQNFF